MKTQTPPHLSPLIPPFMISTALKASQSDGARPIISSTYYEVTVLDKVCRIFLRPQYSQNAKTSQGPSTGSRVKEITSLLTNHFDISVWLIETPLLVDVVTKEIVWSDSDLKPFTPYFLSFLRIGQELTSEGYSRLKRKNPKNFKLLTRSFFYLKDRPSRLKQAYQYPQGRLELLRLVKGQLALAHAPNFSVITKPAQNCAVKREHAKEEIKEESQSHQIQNDIFACPFLDCGRVFHRPCDLFFHFLVQTDCKPFTCEYCQLKFRRKTLLKKHEGSCLMLRNKITQFTNNQPGISSSPPNQALLPLTFQLPPVPPLDQPVQEWLDMSKLQNQPTEVTISAIPTPAPPRFHTLLKLADSQISTNEEALKAWESVDKDDKKERGVIMDLLAFE